MTLLPESQASAKSSKASLKTALRSTVGWTLIGASTMLTAACGGTIPVSGDINVAGDPPPPPPPPKPEPKPEPAPRVEIRDNKIEIHEKIHFEKNKAVIVDDSFSLLDEIAKVFVDHPHIKKVSIEGHTDSDGSDTFNEKLSEARAQSVMDYLTEHGVDAERVQAVGHGEAKPIAENDSPEGMAKNRRVEFIIIEQDVTQQKVEIDAKTGEERVVEEKKDSGRPSLNQPGEEKPADDKSSDRPSLSAPAK